MFPSSNYQQGISLIVILVLLAVISVMGLSMANLSVNQQLTSLYSANNAQGILSARAGLNYAAARIAKGQACSGVDSSLVIQGHQVSLGCTQTGLTFCNTGCCII